MDHDHWSHRRAAQHSSTAKLIALLALGAVGAGVVWFANTGSTTADAGSSNRYEDLAAQWKARDEAYQAARQKDWNERDDHAHRILYDVRCHLERLRKAEASHERTEISGALADLGSDLREWSSLVMQDRSSQAAGR
jgi:hypothetical protein